MSEDRDAPWSRAATAAALLAVDPVGLGGVTLRAGPGAVRDAWLALVRGLMPAGAPWRRVPPGVAEGRLVGGLDLAATLVAGRPVAERGLLAEADGGVVIVAMAERMTAAVVGPLCAAIDKGAVAVERDGIAQRVPTRFATVLLDEGIAEERAPAAVTERLAFSLDLDAARPGEGFFTRDDVAAARGRLATVEIADAMIETLAQVALALAVSSARAGLFALRAARAAAALDGRDVVTQEDVTLAAALVLAPRATQLPAPPEQTGAPEDEPASSPEPPPDSRSDPSPGENPETEEGPVEPSAALSDQIVEAARAAIPAGLLAALTARDAASKRPATAGRAGVLRASQRRGRPAGVRRGSPGQGARLAIVDTLRAAAPWQPLRRQAIREPDKAAPGKILVRREDFRVARFKQRGETTTIFVVDASGSTALNRLAEAKGAVELILADCYARRDSVALIVFRGTSAELILPPTRSLARAKRALAGQPGGGGTPLATAIEAAAVLADTIRRKGPTPLAVFLTDGRANVARGGEPGRAKADADAMAAARVARAQNLACLLIDSSPRPSANARDLAAALGARYQPLPYVDARLLQQAVQAAMPSPERNV